MNQSLLIKDGYTERVGFRGSKKRAPIEFTMRPYSGFEGSEQWQRVLQAGMKGEPQTPILVEQILDRITDCTLADKIPWNTEGLTQLRAAEFETLAFAIHCQITPDYMVVDDTSMPIGDAVGEEHPKKRIPYPSFEEREGN
jgi:hypothetical protein